MLSLFEKKIILICGGYDKNIPYEPLGPVICAKVKTLILMGATADKIEAAVKSSSEFSENNPVILRAENMQSRLILTVHDELIVEAPEAEADKAAAILAEEMMGCVQYAVPLTAEVNRGKNWLEAH